MGGTGWKICPISLGSGKYFFLICFWMHRIPISTFLTLNTFPQTIKPAKMEKTVFVDQFQLFPQVWASVSLALLACYNNSLSWRILCSCQGSAFLQQCTGIPEILYCYTEQWYLNNYPVLTLLYTKVSVAHTQYQRGWHRTPYCLVNPKV